MNAWPPIAGTIWEVLGDVASLNVVCHWKWTFGIHNSDDIPGAFSSFFLWIQMWPLSYCYHHAFEMMPWNWKFWSCKVFKMLHFIFLHGHGVLLEHYKWNCLLLILSYLKNIISSLYSCAHWLFYCYRALGIIFLWL